MFDRGLSDDFERIRLRDPGRGWPEEGPSGIPVPAFVGKVTTASASIAVGSFVLVDPTFVLGAETEGGPGQLASMSLPGVPVYLVGPAKPASGDYLVCKYVDNRWVADRTSGGGGAGAVGVIPNCFCESIPTTLTMTSSDPNCNYRMFQSCTIQYGPTPAGYAALNLPARTFLSVQSFADPLSGGAIFRYYLTCLYNQFSLSRVYLQSPFGSPYRDGVLYSWVLGGYGNTCSPFRLDRGSAYPGSDASCGVTIDAA